MDARYAQICSWIQTGKHTILVDYDKANSDRVESNTSELEQPDADVFSDDSTSLTSTGSTGSASPAVEKLLGADDDILIPTPSGIDRVFQEGRETWRRFVVSAQSLPRNSLSAGLNDPSIILKDVPALPKSLPKYGVLAGRPLWHVPCAERDGDGHKHHEDLDLEHLHGTQKYFCLSFSSPIECRASFQSGPCYDKSSGSSRFASATPRGLLLLTLCWSYIFSVRFWELQGKRAIYTPHALRLKPTKGSRARRGSVNLHLGDSASQALVKWLCAILAPKPGWSVEGGGFAPWAAFCSGNTQFAIFTDGAVTFSLNESPPTSVEATELLIELCSLYRFEPSRRYCDSRDPLSPVTAGLFGGTGTAVLPFR